MRPVDRAALHAVLKAGGLVLTATPRLYAALRREHDALRMAEGALAWEDVALRPLRAWMREQAREALPWAGVDAGAATGAKTGGGGGTGASLLLSARQALAVWERVVAADVPPGVLRHEALAELAQEAWGRLAA